ncbi:MAG: hypothetical protein NXI31_00740 [bacterium]|nr:hypothetical protein [bacterium]
MTFKQFMESTIESTWPEDTSPSGWPDFWWESVALEIQNAVVARQEYLREFGRNWLKQNKAKKWQALLAHMAQHLGPLA